ncbi:MAG TPA: hypothetical protein DCY93_00775 [Firmicutes bacterium]|nr:hypothetical protein [Bacillota bacterium]
MKKRIKYLLPLLVLCGLTSCNSDTTTTSTRPSTIPTSTTPSTPSIPSTPITPSTPSENPVNLALDFNELVKDGKPNMATDWTSDFTYTYDKAIVLKQGKDYLMTPPFKTTKGLDVKITGFLDKGSMANGSLVVAVEGLNKDHEAVETVDIKESEIKGTKEQPVDFTVTLKNTSKNITQVRIKIKTLGKAVNFGINRLVVSSK